VLPGPFDNGAPLGAGRQSSVQQRVAGLGVIL
jgi:hypothetical protein